MAHSVSRRGLLVSGLSASAVAIVAAACGGGLSAPAKPTDPPKPADKPTTGPAPTAAAAAPAQPTAVPKAAAAAAGGTPTEIQFWFWADDAYQASLHTDSLKKFHD